MKKLFAIVLSLVMVLSLLPVTAMAEETVIDEISFTGTLPELEVGGTLPDVSAAFAVPDGANYTVSAQWWDNIANADAAVGTAVEQGDSYDLQVNIKVKTGYEFENWDIPISFNDEDARSVFTDCMPVDSESYWSVLHRKKLLLPKVAHYLHCLRVFPDPDKYS